jgi:hypothetical protein
MHDSQVRTAMTGQLRTGQPGQDNNDRTAGQDFRDRTPGAGLLGQISQDRTARTGQPEQDSQDCTVRTEQPRQDNQDRTTMKGQLDTTVRQERKERTR